MSNYRTADGALFTADSSLELMEKLRADSWNPEDSLEDYIIATARACVMQNGKQHRSDSAENLVEDMLESGLVETIVSDLKGEYRQVRFRGETDETPPAFFIVTAYNPDGKNVAEAENQEADEKLGSELHRLEFNHFRMTGGSPDFSHAEPGYAIVCNREQALCLAKEFSQDAVYEVREGRVFLVSALTVAAVDEEIGMWVDLLDKDG